MGKKRKICENCGSEFASEVGWLQHVRGGRCQKLEDMSHSQEKENGVMATTFHAVK